MAARREPERTCVGCRGTAPKRDLLRLVRGTDGEVRVDPSGSARGRGAYVHRTSACAEATLAKGALARALRTKVDEDGAARLGADLMREVVE